MTGRVRARGRAERTGRSRGIPTRTVAGGICLPLLLGGCFTYRTGERREDVAVELAITTRPEGAEIYVLAGDAVKPEGVLLSDWVKRGGFRRVGRSPLAVRDRIAVAYAYTDKINRLTGKTFYHTEGEGRYRANVRHIVAFLPGHEAAHEAVHLTGDREVVLKLEKIPGAVGSAAGPAAQAAAGPLPGAAPAHETKPPEAASRGSGKDEPGLLKVSCKPEEAEIFVDGTFAGNAPLEVRLPPGEHVVEVKREGVEPVRREIRIFPGASQTLLIELERP